MHLYFNKEGKLTTIIPHGEIPRQGSTLNIYVLLDEDFFCDKNENYLDWSVNIELSFPDGKMSVPFIPVEEPKLVVFKKTVDSEVTYDLVDKRTYLTYKFKFSPEQATETPGKIEALVSINKTQNTGNTASTVSQIAKGYFGRAEIYIERTFGYAQKFIDKSTEHYKNIMLSINNLYTRKVDKTALQEELDKIKGVNEEDVIEIVKENSEVVNEIDVGLSENFDENSDKQIPTSKAVSLFVKNNSTNTQGMINITYDELKSLRDNAQLIPGQQYRITDYETTTVQLNTRSAGHQFDIIVTADNEIALNENARACPHDEDTYFGGGLKTVRKYTGNFIAGLIPEDIVVSYTITIDREGTYEGELKGGTDKIVELSYKDGTPIFYKNDVDYIESGEEGTDYQDEFTYNGKAEYEGQIYDSWKKIEDGVDVGVIVYTNIVVENIAFTEEKKVIPPVANLAAWEIKYCLDNDSDRFSWSSDYESIYIESEKTWFQYYGYMEVKGKEYIAWAHPEFWTNRLEDTFILTETNLSNLKSGSPVSMVVEKWYDDRLEDGISDFEENWDEISQIKRGKGVIYYMKDERNNECSYDFKNIQFLRRAKDFNEEFLIQITDYTINKAKYNVLSKVSDKKGFLKYGLEFLNILGEEVVDSYFDGDYQGWTELSEKSWICLNDPDWYDDLYYLIKILDYNYFWAYTFTGEGNFKEKDISVHLGGYICKNKILVDENSIRRLPNVVFIGNSTVEENEIINCDNLSLFYGLYRSKIYNSRGATITGGNEITLKNDDSSILLGANHASKLEGSYANVFERNNNINMGNGASNNVIVNSEILHSGYGFQTTVVQNSSSITIGNNCRLCELEGNNLHIGDESYHITIVGSSNVVGNDCSQISLDGSYITVGNNSESISFYPYSSSYGSVNNYRITIGNYCRYINSSKDTSGVVIGDNCESITFETHLRNSVIQPFVKHITIKGTSSSTQVCNVIVESNVNVTGTKKEITLESNTTTDESTIVKRASSKEVFIDEGE